MPEFSLVRLSVLVGIFTLLSGCNFREEKQTGEGVTTTKFARIQEQIVRPRCLKCHEGAGAEDGHDLSSLASMLHSGSVIPFEPEASPFYNSVASGEMPKGGGSLLATEIELVRSWIEAGAGETDDPQPHRPLPTYRWISKNIFETRCVVCHNSEKPRGKVDLSSYERLMASPGNKLKPIVVNDPAKSGIHHEVAEQKMPPEPKKVTPEEKEALRLWIANGALEVTPGAIVPAPGQPPGPPQPTYEWLSKNLLGRRCGSCHGIPYKVASIDFTTHATLLASGSERRKAVTPNLPEQSSIYREVASGRMPPKRRVVTPEEVQVIHEWIKAGALNN